MATEDARYRSSSQYRVWSYSPARLQELRASTNALAKQQIAPHLPADPAPDFVTAEEELRLVQWATVELLRAGEFLGIPTEIRATAAIFFRRFYVTNSVMTYAPTELLKTSLFFACKADNHHMSLGELSSKLQGTTAEQILAGEFLLCQGMRFCFDVHHPFRALEGAILELRRQAPHEEERIRQAHVRTREILKFSPLMTDVYFHYTPSQIMMAALQMVDAGFADMLIPGSGSGDDTATAAHAQMRDRIMGAIANCRAMLEEEPPSRLTEFWITPMKPLRRKLQKCRDPARLDLVAYQRSKREEALNKEKKDANMADDDVFGGGGSARDTKRRKVDAVEDPFGPAL
ncbi:Cyclin-like protein [Emericellopsis cladophorae]|uniref:Cyclin-like protein n=1 Tax=Emericellopsis cladophorae TaxID=2686198 RepID=A0A9P9Y068_9HYPO|nr:Cyclin-like protein [Emericellopsis cladophorae]KAI6781134.1 Cyclin-like protein [Emericellopsis cladophorae]